MKYIFLLLFMVPCLSYAQGDEDGWSGGDPNPTVSIDGLLYKLNTEEHSAKVANGNRWEGELLIPEQVAYEGEMYTVKQIEWIAFKDCSSLTKVTIPKTVIEIQHYAGWEDCKNPFDGCTSLECITVDDDNPSMCSVDGVLFSKDKTQLYSYPVGAKAVNYIVPDGVSFIGINAFKASPFLESVEMPNSVQRMAGGIFSNCKKLKSVRLSESITYIPAYLFDNCESLRVIDIPQNVNGFGENVFRWTHLNALVIRGTFAEDLRNDSFNYIDDSTVIYVQRSEIPKFKKVFSGSIRPIEEYTTEVLSIKADVSTTPLVHFDLQGRRVMGQPKPGIYVVDGKKQVVK